MSGPIASSLRHHWRGATQLSKHPLAAAVGTTPLRSAGFVDPSALSFATKLPSSWLVSTIAQSPPLSDNYRQRENQRDKEHHDKLTGSIALLDDKRERVDTLKSWLDSFRPLPPAVIFSTKRLYDVLYTYNSNAMEGITLTISETELVISHGIAVGG